MTLSICLVVPDQNRKSPVNVSEIKIWKNASKSLPSGFKKDIYDKLVSKQNFDLLSCNLKIICSKSSKD